MTTKNDLDSVVGGRVPLTIEYNGVKLDIAFNRITIAHKRFFIRKWGEKEFKKALEILDFEKIVYMLFILLPEEDRRRVEGALDKMVVKDEKGQDIQLATNCLEALEVFITGDQEKCLELLFALCGVSKDQMNEFEKLPDGKKKEIIDQIESQIGR